MKLSTKTLAVGAIMGLMAAPAYAVPNSTDNPGTAHQPTGTPNATNNPGTTHQPSGTPNDSNNPGVGQRPATVGPNAGLPAKARAYGKNCQDQSKKRSDAKPGTKGTPFSQCVTAMAKLATGRSSNPHTACVELSKQRAAAEPGTKGTPFSQCVVQGAKLLREQQAQS